MLIVRFCVLQLFLFTSLYAQNDIRSCNCPPSIDSVKINSLIDTLSKRGYKLNYHQKGYGEEDSTPCSHTQYLVNCISNTVDCGSIKKKCDNWIKIEQDSGIFIYIDFIILNEKKANCIVKNLNEKSTHNFTIPELNFYSAIKKGKYLIIISSINSKAEVGNICHIVETVFN